MKSRIWVGILLSVFVLGIGAFGYWSYSKNDSPTFIILDNPAELMPSEQESLPTGYSWVPEKYPEVGVNTFDPKDERAYFVIDPYNNNMDEIIKWSESSGKREIYIRFQKPIDSNVVIQGGMIDKLSDFYNDLFPKIDFEWLDVFSVQEAWANSIPGLNCTTPGYFTFPSGATARIDCNFYSSDPVQKANCENNCPISGNDASFEIVFHYPARSCHVYPMLDHIWNNVDRYPREKQLYGGNHTSGNLSVTYCMSAHNSPQYYCQPSDLEINIYENNGHPGFQCTGAQEACATVPQNVNFNDSVLTSKGETIWALQKKVRNKMWLLRHEVQHTYGFSHSSSVGNCSSMNPSGYDTFHCCDSHRYH